MKFLPVKARIAIFSFIIPVLSFIIACTTTPSPAPVPEPNLEQTITSNTEKLNVHFIKMEIFGDAIFFDLGETEILIDGGFGNS